MSKCEFFQNEIEYLWHLVSGKGISPMKQKVKIIMDLASATNISEGRQIKDLIGYSRNFFSIFSGIIQPLNELTKKGVPFQLTEQCQKSLDYIKQTITTSPILA